MCFVYHFRSVSWITVINFNLWLESFFAVIMAKGLLTFEIALSFELSSDQFY